MTELVDGWLQGVTHVPSPNVDERPDGERIELIVLHNISLPPGSYGGGWVAALFMNRLDPQAHPFFAEVAGAHASLLAANVHRADFFDFRLVTFNL